MAKKKKLPKKKEKKRTKEKKPNRLETKLMTDALNETIPSMSRFDKKKKRSEPGSDESDADADADRRVGGRHFDPNSVKTR